MISSTSRSKQVLLTIRIGLSIAIIIYAALHLNWNSLSDACRNLATGKLVASIFLQGCAIALAATRWRLLLAGCGIKLGWFRTTQLVLVGLFFNLFYFGSLGGDAAKFLTSIPHAPQRKGRLALSLAQDRLIGLGGLLILVSGLIIVHWRLLWSNSSTKVLVPLLPTAGAGYIAAAIALWIFHAPDSAKVPSGASLWQNLTLKTLCALFPKSPFLPAISLSAAGHVLAILAGYLAAQAVGINIALSAIGIVIGIMALMLSLPITFAGLGVRDGIVIWLLGIFGFTATKLALALSACLLSINLFWSIAGGLAFYWPVKARLAPNNILE